MPETTSKRQAWFCTTGLPSDVVVEVGDVIFHLHKFPLMAKSKKFHEIITEQETNPQPQKESEDDDDEIQLQISHVTLPDFPGGSETFETAAKFCYAVKIELTSYNVAPIRCAGEVLEMTEEHCEDNLISNTERFLSQTVFQSLNDSIKTLKSCEDVLPLAESLGIVQRCIDSIVSKASSSDPSLFGWPVNDVINPGAPARWFDELVSLSLYLFNRLIDGIRSRNLNYEIIENCLVTYAKTHISGVNRASRRSSSSSSVLSETEQQELLETVVTNLPEDNRLPLRSLTDLTIYFGMLRAGSILQVSDGCKTALEKKIGSRFEQSTLDDLLIPSYSYLIETLYDVDCVQRIVAYFLDDVEQSLNVDVIEDDDNDDVEINRVRSVRLMLVGKLIDGYLSEIATDSNLKPEKFLVLAFALPEQARLYDDGLYRAVDVYLKAHPWIKEEDKEKVCGAMDCQKLTLEACTHAAQNERLPLRAVVQVLFLEQLQLRQAIAGSLMTADISTPYVERLTTMVPPNVLVVEDETERGVTGTTWTTAVRENQVLRLDMDSMKTRVNFLERECSTMRKAIQNIDKVNPVGQGSWTGSLLKKISCKFKTQVCDSHESTIVDSRKGRTHHQKQQ
ncbi:BTB/POZ domain-containing protein At5g66560-like [Rutidosis leptorrhynchoides]|uniref:BTB/POZ domain-containing protein At5g66560-like n=1 Tax=Rutidosis leptorrhynchoides TaxID=125765 RepID=UPI003A98E1A5